MQIYAAYKFPDRDFAFGGQGACNPAGVKQECNGLYRYDRTPKLPPEQLRAVFARPPESRELPLPVPAVS